MRFPFEAGESQIHKLVLIILLQLWYSEYMMGKQKKVLLSDMLKVRPVHFNDRKSPCGSHKDRHEKLGQGLIGMEALKRIALHPALSGRPFILETPNDDEGYIQEIHTVLNWLG